jgi:hypothetical protein
MKFRSFIRPLALVAGLVLVVGLALLGRLTLNTPLYLLDRGGQGQPTALQFVPKQSTVVASVLVRPDRLANLWEYLAAPRLRPAVQQDQARIEQLLLANTGLTYSRDIQPWLGEEVTAALVSPDLDQDPVNGETPGYLVALACDDSATAQATLELYWQNRAIAGDALTFEDFSGSRLIYARRGTGRSPNGDSPQLATVLVANRYLLVANHPDVLRQALTAAQSTDLNLQADRRYKTALRSLPQPRVGLLALNLPALNQWAHPDSGATVEPVAFGTLDDQVGWGLLSWQLTRQGLVGHTALLAAQGHRLHPRSPQTGDWGAIAAYLPESLGLAAVGSDLATLGRDLKPLLTLVSGEGTNPLTRLLDNALGSGVADRLQTGIAQTYGVGLTAPVSSAPSDWLPEWLVVAPQSEPLSEALEALTALTQEHGLGQGILDVQGTPAIAWTRLSLPGRRGAAPLEVVAQVAGLQAQVDQYEVLTASPALLEAVLHPKEQPRQPPRWWPLATEQPGSGYIHIDWPQIQPVAQLPQWRLWSTAAQPVLKHLREITLVSGDRSESMQTGRIVVQLSNQ